MALSRGPNLVPEHRKSTLIRTSPGASLLPAKNRSHLFSHGGCDGAAAGDGVEELREVERLIAVGQGPLGIGMDFEDQAVGAGGDGGDGHVRDQVGVAGAVAGIDDDRQVRLVMQIGHRGQRQREAGVALERANAALAEHDVRIAVVENVFGGQQQLFDRGAGPRLSSTGFLAWPTASSRR